MALGTHASASVYIADTSKSPKWPHNYPWSGHGVSWTDDFQPNDEHIFKVVYNETNKTYRIYTTESGSKLVEIGVEEYKNYTEWKSKPSPALQISHVARTSETNGGEWNIYEKNNKQYIEIVVNNNSRPYNYGYIARTSAGKEKASTQMRLICITNTNPYSPSDIRHYFWIQYPNILRTCH